MKSKNYFINPLFILFLVSSLLAASAQQLSENIEPGVLELIRKVPDEMGKETGALILLKDYRMTINNKGEENMVIRVLGKVYNKQALSDFSQIPLGYNSYYEQPTLNYARVILKDGTVREVSKDAVQIKTSPQHEGLQYSDYRYLSFALSGMEIGAAFDYQVTFDQKTPVIEGEWFNNHWFAGMLHRLSPPFTPRIDPVLNSRFHLIVPRGSEFQYHLSAGSEKPKKISTETHDEYLWEMSNLPPIKIEESMPPLNKLNPVLTISSIKDWAEIDQWAASKILTKIEVTEDIVNLTKGLVSGAENDDEKIKSIADYIQNKIQYIYADLDRGGYTPHSVSEILASRYGDCKDQTILFISMLKAVGIEAFPALINPYPYDENPEIPSPLFIHLFTFIPRTDRNLWLDMTSGVTPFPKLSCMNQGRTAFIIDGKGGKLMNTPVSKKDDNVSIFNLQSSFDKETAKITINIETSGMQSDLLKSFLKTVSSEEQKQFFEQMVASYAEEAVIDSIRLTDVYDPELHFKVSITYHFDSAWQKGQGIFNYGGHALIPISFLTNADVRALPSDRSNDLVIKFPCIIKGIERYVPPEKDLLPVVFPKNDSMINDFFSFTQKFRNEKNVISSEWMLMINETTISKEEYKSYLKSLKDLREMISWKINFVDPNAYATNVLSKENPNHILADYNNILKEDPANVFALLIKGYALHKLKQYDSSLKTYLQVIKIDPENKYAYQWIFYPMLISKNINYALEYLNKAIQLDPEFKEAYYTRARYYDANASYDKALADINSVLKFKPGDIIALKYKAYLLGRLGKNMESIAVYQEALSVDSTDAFIYSALAEKYMLTNSNAESIEMYHKAIKLNPDNPYFYGNLGWSYYLAGDDQKCIEYSLKAVEIKPETYYARFNIALANLRSGNISEARRIYGELKKLKRSIPESEIKGAIKDLMDLKTKGLYVKETNAILNEFF